MKQIKKLIKEFNDFRQIRSNTYYLSIGENCLTDNILERHGLKSFSTPYSHGRSNLDYAIDLERNNYDNLLDSKHLYYEYLGQVEVVRNKYYANSDRIYHRLHQNGFEFTHHDVKSNMSHNESYKRKVLRMKSLNKSKKIKFLYHYRDNDTKNFELIVIKAQQFLSFYRKKNIKCEFIFFTQEIILEMQDRGLTCIYNFDGVTGYVLKTLEVWAGDNLDVFWARKDEDLIKKMIKDIK